MNRVIERQGGIAQTDPVIATLQGARGQADRPRGLMDQLHRVQSSFVLQQPGGLVELNPLQEQLCPNAQELLFLPLADKFGYHWIGRKRLWNPAPPVAFLVA